MFLAPFGACPWRMNVLRAMGTTLRGVALRPRRGTTAASLSVEAVQVPTEKEIVALVAAWRDNLDCPVV